MRTTVSIPDALLRRAKKAAAARGGTLSDVVVDALRAALDRPTGAKPEPFALITFRGTSSWPDLDFDRTSGLLAAEDESRYRVAEAPEAYKAAATPAARKKGGKKGSKAAEKKGGKKGGKKGAP